MKLLNELLEHNETYDKARATRHRVWALKAQQAIAENDGWTSELSVPKPMDQETGEVFDWTGLATHEPDMNTLAYSVSVFEHDDSRIKATLNFRHLGWPRKGFYINLTKPLDVCSKEFADKYRELLQDVIDDQVDELNIYDLDDSWPSEEGFHEDAEEIFNSQAAEWLKDYEKLSNGAVNSQKLAHELLTKIKEGWNDKVDSRIEELKERDADERNPKQQRVSNRWGGRA